QRLVERGPPAVGVELRLAGEQRGAAGTAPVDARRRRVDVLAGPGRLGPALPQHPELLRVQPHPPLVLGAGEGGVGLVAHPSTLRPPAPPTPPVVAAPPRAVPPVGTAKPEATGQPDAPPARAVETVPGWSRGRP